MEDKAASRMVSMNNNLHLQHHYWLVQKAAWNGCLASYSCPVLLSLLAYGKTHLQAPANTLTLPSRGLLSPFRMIPVRENREHAALFVKQSRTRAVPKPKGKILLTEAVTFTMSNVCEMFPCSFVKIVLQSLKALKSIIGT